MHRKSNIIVGSVLVVIGLLFLLKNVGILNFEFNIFNIGYMISMLWPSLFLILPGIAFHLGFLSNSNKNAGLLVPGGILLTVGVTCQLSMLFGIWGVMWPGFILAPAVGLFELYAFGNREKALLIPVCILGGLSLIFFTTISLKELWSFSFNRIMIPLILIVFGALILFKRHPQQKDS